MPRSKGSPLATDRVIHLPLQAPAYLNADGLPGEDPGGLLRERWVETLEIFSRLQAQRVMEVLRAMFREIPAGEGVALFWEYDESTLFELTFDNGWNGLGDYGDVLHIGLNNTKVEGSPPWFSCDATDLKRWRFWVSVLRGEWVVSPEVDTVTHGRLQQVVATLGGRITATDLPALEEVLVGRELLCALEQSHLERSTDQPKPPGAVAARARGCRQRL